MGGIAAVTAIRNRDLVPAHVPIYILTASISQGIEEECKKAGANRVLSKASLLRFSIVFISEYLFVCLLLISNLMAESVLFRHLVILGDSW
jgi:CheY-like chemotaxis protein